MCEHRDVNWCLSTFNFTILLYEVQRSNKELDLRVKPVRRATSSNGEDPDNIKPAP